MSEKKKKNNKKIAQPEVKKVAQPESKEENVEKKEAPQQTVKKKIKFNWVDALLIVMVIVLIFGAVSRFSGKIQEITASTHMVEYKVKAVGLRTISAEYLQQSMGMQFNMGEKARTDTLGTLVDFEIAPALSNIEMADGSIVAAERPERYDAILTLRLNATVNSSGYYTPQLSNIGVGSNFIIKNKYIVTQATVIELKEVE